MENSSPAKSAVLVDATRNNSGETGDEPTTRGPLADFVDELELKILDLNEKLYLRESRSEEAIGEPFSSSEFQVETIFDILDENSQSVGKLGICLPRWNHFNFIISINAGHAVVSLKKSGCLIPRIEVTGAGLLTFYQVVTPCGHTLEDSSKKLLQIRTGWIPYFPFLLFFPRFPATMKLVNLDGSPAGTFTYLNTNDSSGLCIQYIRGLDRKAKYMILAACLLLLSAFFSELGKIRSSIYLGILYLSMLISIGVITWSVYEITSGGYREWF